MNCQHCGSVVSYGSYVRCLKCGYALCDIHQQCLTNHTQEWHPDHAKPYIEYKACSASNPAWGFVALIALTLAAIFLLMVTESRL